jgi:FkbM family methyltransferase
MPNLTRAAASADLALLARLLRRMGPDDRSWLARHVVHDRRDPAVQALADFCSKTLLAWKNKQYDPALNGEEDLLRRLAPFNPAVLIDVGGNIGEWSLAAARHLPQAQIHAFEIVPATAQEFIATIAAAGDAIAGRIRLNQFGLADREDEVTMFISSRHHTASTMMRSVVDISGSEFAATDAVQVKARVVTGDSYIQQHGIAQVGMLKIDVEGAEFAVLQGFSEAFARHAIDLVQFEYGPLNVGTRQFLADYFGFLAERGFVIGKLYPEGVAFKPYDVLDEDFIGPNYVACRADRQDLIGALRCEPFGLE